VRPQPVWRLRTERVIAAVCLLAVALVLSLSVVNRETPYRVIAKPLESRIHIGKDTDTPAPATVKANQAAQPVSPETHAAANSGN
jgi:hypothetical protein